MKTLFKSFCEAPPRLLSANDPVRGIFKASPGDFEVREIPLQEPDGGAEHLYCWIEKQDLGSEELLKHCEEVLELAPGEVGIAGMKDKRARTFQGITVPRRVESLLSRLETPQLTVHRVAGHSSKLRRGQLAGNAFRVCLREVSEADKARLGGLVSELGVRGVPNYFGPQRFGTGGKNIQLGLALCGGEGPRVKPFLRQLAVHSLQSAVFNVALGHRIQEGLWGEVVAGDVIEDLKLGVPSVVFDVEREQARLDAGRVGVLGPLVGPKMRRAKGPAGQGEQRAMEAVGLTPVMLAAMGRWAPGDRRLYKLRVEALMLEWEQGEPVLTFELPPGGYATALLNELVIGG